jgi:hypothetical protein
LTKQNYTGGDIPKYIDFKSSKVLNNVFSIDSLNQKDAQELKSSMRKEEINAKMNYQFEDPKINNSKSNKRSMLNSSQGNIVFKTSNMPPKDELNNKTINKPSASAVSMRRSTLGAINNNWILEKPGMNTMKAQYNQDPFRAKKLSKGANSFNNILKPGINRTSKISEITNSMLTASVSTRLNMNPKMTGFYCGKSGMNKPKSSLMSNLENLGFQHSAQSVKNSMVFNEKI